MELIEIHGGHNLSGIVKIAGAKNAALPIMMATILIDSPINLSNIPILKDVKIISALLKTLGVTVEILNECLSTGTTQTKITPSKQKLYKIAQKFTSSNRASLWALGPLLAKHGKAILALPGGCNLGERKIDIHIDALRKMGAKIKIEKNNIIASCPNKLQGIKYDFPKKSVGSTANIIMAASLAEGTSCLTNCATEPEITDLAEFLVSCGAKIDGIGTSNLIISGVDNLHGTEYKIIPDRIETGTFMVAAAITRSNIKIENAVPKHLYTPIDILSSMGVKIDYDKETILVNAKNSNLISANIDTAPFPYFPTDLQAIFTALLCTVSGQSRITENIFENRYLHLNEFKKMGAKVDIKSNHEFIINGVQQLTGADLYPMDLRASAALICAGLFATNHSRLYNLHYLDRGYANIEQKLQKLGAKIIRKTIGN